MKLKLLWKQGRKTPTCCLLDLAFLADLTEKLNQLNLQLQAKDKSICEMISAVKAFKAKLSFYMHQLKKNRLQHFPSVLKMIESHTSAPEVFDLLKYCDLLSRLGQEFEERFGDFEKMANPFMELDIDNISKQMAELFDVSALEMEMEVINLQNNIHLKSQQHSPNFGRPRSL